MDLRSLKALLNTLREHGVAEFSNSDGLTVRLHPPVTQEPKDLGPKKVERLAKAPPAPDAEAVRKRVDVTDDRSVDEFLKKRLNPGRN